jgi:hypothetical protein
MVQLSSSTGRVVAGPVLDDAQHGRGQRRVHERVLDGVVLHGAIGGQFDPAGDVLAGDHHAVQVHRITVSAFAPRSFFISVDNRFRIRRSASLLGLVSSLPLGNGGW